MSDSRGELRVVPIDGLRYRLTRPVPHEDGHVIEIAREPDALDLPWDAEAAKALIPYRW